MRIFRVQVDVNRFQSLHVDTDRWHGDLLSMVTFDCTPRAVGWKPPPVYVLHPKLQRGNFLDFELSTNLVVDQAALEQLEDLLEMSGELLPLPHEGMTFHIMNVLECVNALDEHKTKWVYGKSSGGRIGIESYAFHSSRLTEAPLFKIPQTCKSEILTITGFKDPNDEFKSRVERCRLQGLIFEEIWSDEQ